VVRKWLRKVRTFIDTLLAYAKLAQFSKLSEKISTVITKKYVLLDWRDLLTLLSL
jgi:hypothetical protein